MARAKGSGKWNTGPAEMEFASKRLTEDDKEAFDSWQREYETALDEFLSMATREGYKVSLKHDGANLCFMGMLTMGPNKHHNANLCIISRSNSPLEALMMSLYKVYVLYPDERQPVENRSFTWG